MKNQKHHESFFISQNIVFNSREDIMLEIDSSSKSLSSIRIVIRRLKERIHKLPINHTKLNH